MGAGAPVKLGIVREELVDWFCLLKRSVHGRILVPFVLQKAATLVEDWQVEPKASSDEEGRIVELIAAE